MINILSKFILSPKSFSEAIAGIIKYSPDEVSILRRKVVTRDILFAYLDEKNIPIRLPATKNDLIDKIIEYWKKLNSASSNGNDGSDQNSLTQIERIDKSSQEGSIEKLAEHFAQWFYTQMNTEVVEDVHFFSDAKFKLSMISNNDCDNTLVENDPQEISNALQKVKVQNNLFFNPNFTNEGVQGRMDPHGLVMVLVCGTLHVQETIVGVFEQTFALARDPFSDNNWKIKSTELILRSKSNVVNQPRLCDSELTSDLLALPSN